MSKFTRKQDFPHGQLHEVGDASTHHRISKTFTTPVIDTFYNDIMKATLDKYKGKDIVIAGDVRNDSPGHSAMYCTYTFLEYDSKDIVACEIIDKRMTQLKSTNMEKEGLLRALRYLLEQGTNVCTDAHPQISALFKQDDPAIKHGYDTWHGAKNFGKKLTAVSLEARNKDLRPWIQDAINHFWYCSRTAKGNADAFIARWVGILHNVVDVHEWLIGDSAYPAQCEHGIIPDTPDTPNKWLETASDAHNALAKVVIDPRFLHTLKYYVNFRGPVTTTGNSTTLPNNASKNKPASTNSASSKTAENGTTTPKKTGNKAELSKANSTKQFQQSVRKSIATMAGEKTIRTSILTGDVSVQVPSTSKVVRIFTSSTFTDTMHERNTWMREAYPELRTFCQALGYEFQVVDMRWGVRDEATDDHTSGDLCLNELQLCQQLSTGPTFISLLANKYGYRPLPRTIDVAQFHTLLEGIENAAAKEHVNKWYIRDDNAVPPEYVLQPISRLLPDRLSENEDKKAAAKDQWFVEQGEMQDALEQSARDNLEESEAEKFYVSITEKEVQAGLLDDEDHEQHCLWFWRRIENIDNLDPKEQKTLPKYIDCAEKEKRWKESRRLLHVLEESKMKSHLRSENVHQYTVKWTEEGIDPENAEHSAYLKKMTGTFTTEMMRLIDKGIEKRAATELTDPLMLELCQHIHFCQQKCENFCGRSATLEKIKAYIKSSSDKPLVIHGASGCGKTSLLAMTAKLVPSWIPKTTPAIVLRFIGTTPDSSNISGLLISIITQIKTIYGETSPIPESLPDLAEELDFVLSFAKPSLVLVIILDSLDQMDISYNARSLFWLPRTLNKFVKFIVSTLDDDEFECFPKLKAMFKEEECLVPVPELNSADAESIIQQWLKSRNRTLTPKQSAILNQSVYHSPLPLFLKLSFENAQRWHSYWDDKDTVLQNTIRKSIEDLFSKLESKHGEVFVSRTLGYLTASKSGLSESELEDILSCDDDVLNDVYQFWQPPVRRLPPLLLVRLKTEILQYIVERGSDGVRVLYWYHRQFIETARRRYCGPKVAPVLHTGLADFFSGKWGGGDIMTGATCGAGDAHSSGTPNLTFGFFEGKKKPYVGKKKKNNEADRHVTRQPLIYRNSYNVRRLNNAPYHRTQSDNVKELKDECLMNFEFLQAKAVATSVRHILDDFAFARKLFPKDGDFETMGAVFEMSQGALLYDPLQLAPQLLDRLASEQHTAAFLEQCKRCSVPYLCPDQEVLMKPGGQLVFCLTGHQGPVNSVDIRQDGKVAASTSDDDEDSVKTWDVIEGKLLKSYDGLNLNPRRVRFVCEDKYILIDYDECIMAIHESGETAFSIDNVGGQTAVGGRGKSLLATFCDKTVDVYNIESGEVVATVEITASELEFSVEMPSAIAGSEKYVVLTDIDQHYLTVFSFPEKTLSNWVQVFSTERKPGQPDLTIDSMVITPDEKQFIVSNVRDNDLHIYDIVSQRKLKTIKGSRMDFCQNYRMTTDGNFLYFPGEYEIVVWNLRKEQRSCILVHPGSLRDAICWSWKIMVTATDDPTVRVWDLSRKEKKTKNQSRVMGFKVRYFLPMPNPRYVVVLAQTDKTDAESVCLQVYDIPTKTVVREGTPNAPPGIIKVLNNKRIAVVTSNLKIKTINLDSMNVDRVFDGDLSAYTIDLQIKADGSEIITHTRGRQHFKIYDTSTGTTTAIIRRPPSVKKDKKTPFEETLYADKGWRVLAGRISDGPWILFDIRNRQCIRTINPNEYMYTDVPAEKAALTDDGQIFIYGVNSFVESPGVSKEKYKLISFVIWDIKQDRRIAMCEDGEYQGHYFDTVNRKGVDVSVDEIHVLDAERLLTVHDDFILRVWDRTTGELLSRLEGHNSAVQVFIKEEGPYFFSFATYEEENAIRVWDRSTLQCLASYRLDHTVVSTRICEDGRQFITSTKSPTARLIHWKLEGVDSPTSLASNPVLFKGTASNTSMTLVCDEDNLVSPNDPDTDEEESDDED